MFMIEEKEIGIIKENVRNFLDKMTVGTLGIEIKANSFENTYKENKEVVDIALLIEEPQMLIGQNGQTLFEFSRLLKIILNKKLQKDFYVNVDINDYKKKKVEFLKELAKTTADQVVQTKEKKELPPMPSYERRVIHAELASRQDIISESQGEGNERHIVISPWQ